MKLLYEIIHNKLTFMIQAQTVQENQDICCLILYVITEL